MTTVFKDKSTPFEKLTKFGKKAISVLKRKFFNKDLYFSQDGQDRYILDYFNHKRDGFFIEIGAYNGVTFSNTYKMETLGWRGICIEPNPDMFKKVLKTRKCAKYNVAIAKEDGEVSFNQIIGDCAVLSGIQDAYDQKHTQRILRELKNAGGKMEAIKVQAMSFDTLMADFKEVSTIDYISIDTEGGEFEILKSIDFKKYDIKTLSIENNYKEPEIREFFEQNGYKCAAKLGLDEIYIKV